MYTLLNPLKILKISNPCDKINLFNLRLISVIKLRLTIRLYIKIELITVHIYLEKYLKLNRN